MDLFKKWNEQSLVKKIIEIIIFVLSLILVIVGINKIIEYNETKKLKIFKEGNYIYNYNYLNDNQKELYNAFCEEMSLFIDGQIELDKEDSYYILGRFKYSDYDVTKEEASQVISAFSHDNPGFYYLISAKALIKDDMICPIIEEIYMDHDYRFKLSKKMANNAYKFLEKIKDYNDYDKFLEIYNYVINNSDYELDEFGKNSKKAHANNIVGVLDGDEATNSICQGFAKTIAFLANASGIKCLTVGSDKINHMFNVVCIEGIWYYADATNDNKENTYKYFLCGEVDYWLYFDSDVPLNNNSLSEGISWQAELPEISKESYIKNK